MAVNYEIEHHCPVYDRVVHPDLCYDSMMCLRGFFKTDSVPELQGISDIEEKRRICENCKYSE